MEDLKLTKKYGIIKWEAFISPREEKRRPSLSRSDPSKNLKFSWTKH
jgi:hypothetical protein